MIDSRQLPDDKKSNEKKAARNSIALLRRIFDLMASAKLAMVLLIAILACCLLGVTIYRGDQAWALIFGTIWFNGLLTLLVVNVGFCFFGRMWGRKVTIVTFGMILFHLSFVAMFGGIIYNSLYYFRGLIRLTEGETLPSGVRSSYDAAESGRFFKMSKLKGETMLTKMHMNYEVDGKNKRNAYEIVVGRGKWKEAGVIYTAHSLEHNGFGYYRDKEGFSALIVLYDNAKKELFGAHVPLQSLKQKDDKFLYTTGSSVSPGSFPFPPSPERPVFDIQVAYQPSRLKERTGDAIFHVYSHAENQTGEPGETIANGKVMVGELFKTGNYYLSVQEIRYWVGMRVVHEPGKPIVLASLWIGLGGMVITFVGRMRQRRD